MAFSVLGKVFVVQAEDVIISTQVWTIDYPFLTGLNQPAFLQRL